MTRGGAGNVHVRRHAAQPPWQIARAAAPRVNTYPINVTLPQRALREVLTLESVEAVEMAREAGLETP